ncbi:MAG: META domain-containing protein [Xanthomonadales bacterium]|nr:META domain-containing protein [Xanthomonadales bacterium]
MKRTQEVTWRRMTALLAWLSLLALAACATQDSSVTAQDAVPLPAPTIADAAFATYSGLFGGPPLTLDAGRWQGAPYAEGAASAPRAGLAGPPVLRGDLDGDGGEETVVLVWTSTGGSGTFDYLAALDRASDGRVVNRGTAPLGDRVKLRAARIADGRIELDLVQSGPGDAACCPGQKVRRIFALRGDALSEVALEDQGRLSLADLAGEWVLEPTDIDGVPDGVEVTLTFDGERISGQSGCNRYGGALTEENGAGQVRLDGPLAATRMMCPEAVMAWERRYLHALEHVQAYSFSMGRLVLTWYDEQEPGTLFFAPSQPSPTP